ncbi:MULTISPECIES: hypothetical protein [Flavobacterium]|uniref:hypothetical protein n=1 Tax=Flavobacterium TaxID=237 RepID=UPI0029CAB968|nr:hypothetical protein [Flavobacterium sp. N1946]
MADEVSEPVEGSKPRLFTELFHQEGVWVEAHVFAEFVDGDHLVFLFVVLFFDPGVDVAGLALAFSGDLLDVFGVDTHSFHGCFFVVVLLFLMLILLLGFT